MIIDQTDIPHHDDFDPAALPVRVRLRTPWSLISRSASGNRCTGRSDTSWRCGSGCCPVHTIPSKVSNVEIIYKSCFGVKKYLSTSYPRKIVDKNEFIKIHKKTVHLFDTKY